MGDTLRTAGPVLLLLFAGCGAGGAGGPGSRPWADAPPPNVLFLSIDTLRADSLGFYGYERPTSPRLDAFAEGAVVFESAQASASWTLPGLASVFTSQFTSTHQCLSFGSRLSESFTTLTELLLAAGYDTACVTSHVFTTTRHGLQQGFVHFDDSYAYPAVDPEDAITSQVISDEGIRFLEQKRAAADPDPWFLWLHYFDPHDRYMEHPGITDEFVTPGERDNDTVRRDLYDGEIRYTDGHVGRVLDALGELGLAEDTIVVLFSDHGEEFLDHGSRGHGHTLFRELVRVPLAIRAPGIEPRRVTRTVRTVDVLPTLLELVGLAPPADAAGTGLVGLMRGEEVAVPPALAEIHPTGAPPQDSLTDDRYKLVVQYDGDTKRSMLFDLRSDPLEQRDVAAEHPEVVERLGQELLRAKKRALELAGRYTPARELDLTPGQLDDLKELGYGGDE